MPADDLLALTDDPDDAEASGLLAPARRWDGLLDRVPAGEWTGPRPELVEEVTVAMAGSLNLRRTVLRMLTVLRPELADWAVVALTDLRGGPIRLFGGNDVGGSARVSSRVLAGTTLERIVRGGHRELLHVAAEDHAADSLATMLPVASLRDEAASLHPVDVLGLPLTARGSTLGALILVRGQGHGFGDQDIEVAEQVALRTAVALDSARLYEERSQIAAALQRSLRQPVPPALPNVDLAARFRSAAEHLDISGDFFDVYDLGETGDDLLVTLGDVAGKGVEAALLTGRARQSLRTAAYFEHRPGLLLSALNSVVYEDRSDRFVTVVCSRVTATPDWLDVEVAVAGHTAPLVLRADGTVGQLDVEGTVAGVLPRVEYETTTVRLLPGDTLLMFTDGVEEARGQNGFYGLERVVELLPAYARAGSDVICAALEQDLLEHLDGRSHDDIALFAISCPPLTEAGRADQAAGTTGR